jgi:radical SAM superfamily enzyme YgiQ (UPF0313 family)
MRVAFIQRDPLPDPAMMTLASATVFSGHQVTVFIPAAERNLARALQRFAPDALLFAPQAGFEDWALAMAERLGEVTGGAPNLFTGSHATDHPEMAREQAVDLILVGDPETTLPEVLLKMERGQGNARDLPGTAGTVAANEAGELTFGAQRRVVDDLDQLPLADMEIYRRYPFVRQQTTLSFATGRGVTENTHAGFRIGSAELSRRFAACRRHSVDEAMRRLHLHIQRRPIYRRVAFRDDSLLMDTNEGWLRDFLALYRQEIQLPFSCVARPDQLDSPTISLLAEAGCDRIRLGIESGDPQLRAALCGVEISDDQIVGVSEELRDRDIAVHTISFLGLPGETTDSALRSLDLNIALAPAHGFAILVADERGASICAELERLQLLFPLAVRFPALRGQVEGAMRSGNTHLLRRVFQFHHDASFVTSGELSPFDILRIVARMKRSRNDASTIRPHRGFKGAPA